MENEAFSLRTAAEDDAAALAAIYAPFVTDTTVTFETEAPDGAAFADRITDTLRDYPYLVCTRGTRPVGYAYAHRIRARAAYDWAAELSIYLAPGAQGKGVGKALYACLIDLLQRQGLRTLYACITLPNDRSIGLHHALGFADAGVWKKSGWKHGGWRDVAWLERELPGETPPQPVLPFPKLNETEVQTCLRRYTEMITDKGE